MSEAPHTVMQLNSKDNHIAPIHYAEHYQMTSSCRRYPAATVVIMKPPYLLISEHVFRKNPDYALRVKDSFPTPLTIFSVSSLTKSDDLFRHRPQVIVVAFSEFFPKFAQLNPLFLPSFVLFIPQKFDDFFYLSTLNA